MTGQVTVSRVTTRRLETHVRNSLTRLRDALDIPQEEVVRLLGWKYQSRLSRYESGARLPMDDLDRLARLYGTTLVDLLAEKTTDPTEEPEVTTMRSVFFKLKKAEREALMTIMQAMLA